MMPFLPITKPIIPLEPNATLYFQQPTGEYKVDPITLNEEQLFNVVPIEAAIVELGYETSENETPGLDNMERRVRGFLLTDSLPCKLRSSDRVKILIDSSGIQEEGTLFLSERFTAMGYNIVPSIGIPFEAYLQTTGGG